MLDGFFKISERGSTVARELRGGVVTFFTMAYIVVLNPLIIGSFAPTGPGAHPDVLGNILPVGQVAAVTALVAGVMTILFGMVANLPFALASVTTSRHGLPGSGAIQSSSARSAFRCV